jgi:iron complex outermembrane receptor protein
MTRVGTKTGRVSAELLRGVCAAAFMVAITPAAALAQAQPAAGAAAPAVDAERPSDLSDIVVTGTRVIRDGYNAPTPTSVIGAAEIAAKAPANIADYLNTLPSLAGSATPRSTSSYVSAGLIGINALNLRSLNPNRTLVLLDGQRVGASSLTGLVDINQFPQQLVKRVDIVTGGASASWGSDAVAGVVNFVLDKDFTGLKGQIQGGVTDYGDDRSYNISLAAGAKFADGRGHILISGEIAHNDGINGIGKRKWYNGRKILFNPANPSGTAGNGQPQLLIRDNVGIAVATPGGLITSGPLRGTYFGSGGTPTQFNYGSIVSGNYMVGGDWRYADYGTSGDLDPEQSRQNLFGRLDYELTDSVKVYAQGSYSRATARNAISNQFNLGNITIQPDNAFIPASIRSQVTAPFSLGSINQDLGPLRNDSTRKSWRAVVGANGSLNMFGSEWTWDVYGQRTVNDIYTSALVTVTARYQGAIDSVRNANGAIVCRSTLANPTDGCVPYNIFGTGVNSQAAIDYVKGTAWGRNHLTENVVAGTLRGEPFSTWAGPVSLATGLEHRKEAVSGSNDPLSTTRSYFAGNYLASFGSYNVTEAFLETVIPLAKDSPFAHSLDLNAAVRATDYSSSGYVTTWKAGITYSPVEDITFRFTRSRDIRAANLAELYQSGLAGLLVLSDPFRNNASTTFQGVTRGNANLKPEKADSLGLGVVVQPSFLPGFSASVDYYDIRIKDAIITVAPATVLAQCFTGNALFCSQIGRDASGVINSLITQPVNFAKQKSRGIDFEASYRTSFLNGNLSLRVLATRFIKNELDNGINIPTDNVGSNRANVSAASATGSGAVSLPKWRYVANLVWDRDPLTLSLTARGFSSGVYDTSFIECTTTCPTQTAAQAANHMTIDNNHIPGAIYFDTNITVKLPGNIQTFVSVDNILNKDPVQVAYGPNLGAAPIPVNASLYDTLGRVFRIGVRFKL